MSLLNDLRTELVSSHANLAGKAAVRALQVNLMIATRRVPTEALGSHFAKGTSVFS